MRKRGLPCVFLWVLMIFLFSNRVFLEANPLEKESGQFSPGKSGIAQAKDTAAAQAKKKPNRLYKEIKFTVGKDKEGFTRDDAIYDYTLYEYDSNGRLLTKKSYNVNKDSPVLPSADRLREYWVYKYAPDGKNIREVYYSSRGMDNKWFTDSDIETYHIDFEFDSSGRKIRATKEMKDSTVHHLSFDPAGKNIIATKDIKEGAVHYINFEYDSQGRQNKDIEFRNSGLDSEWFTADDEIEKYHIHDYDNQDRLIWAAEYHADHLGRGPDGRWFTSDDVIFSIKVCSYNEEGAERLTKKYINKGPDGRWFTDDDVLQYYIVYYYKDITQGKPRQ